MKWIIFLLFFVAIPLYCYYPSFEKNDVTSLGKNFLGMRRFMEKAIGENNLKFDADSNPDSFIPVADTSFRLTKNAKTYTLVHTTKNLRVSWTDDSNDFIKGMVAYGQQELLYLYYKETKKWIFTGDKEKVFKPDNFAEFEKIRDDLRNICSDYYKQSKQQ